MHELGEIHSFNRISSQSWLSCSENRISEPFSNVSRVTCNPQIGYHENISTWTTENQPQCSFHVKPPILDQNSSDASRNPTAAAPPRSNNATLNLPTASLRASNFCTSKHNHNHNHNHNTNQKPTSIPQNTNPQKWSTPSSSTSTPRMMPRASPSSSPSCKRRARSTLTTRRLLVGE